MWSRDHLKRFYTALASLAVLSLGVFHLAFGINPPDTFLMKFVHQLLWTLLFISVPLLCIVLAFKNHTERSDNGLTKFGVIMALIVLSQHTYMNQVEPVVFG